MFNETKSDELLKISQMFTKDSVNFKALVSKVVQGTTRCNLIKLHERDDLCDYRV